MPLDCASAWVLVASPPHRPGMCSTSSSASWTPSRSSGSPRRGEVRSQRGSRPTPRGCSRKRSRSGVVPRSPNSGERSSPSREIRRLESLRDLVVADRIDARIALGQAERVITELESSISAWLLWERPRAQLMLALYRSGRQADALDEFRTTRVLFNRELGIAPGTGAPGARVRHSQPGRLARRADRRFRSRVRPGLDRGAVRRVRSRSPPGPC